MNSTSVSIVIPNWNGQEVISACLKSLQNQTVKAHLIVVDNGSTDGSVEIISKQFPEVEVVKLAKNIGFAGGVNAGIKLALEHGHEFVALFNNDAVAEPNWLSELLSGAQKHLKAGIITGKFMRMDKKHFDSTGDYYSTWGMPFPRGRNQLDTGQYDKSEYVFGASGGASLYRCSMLKQVGLFDESFFAYFEDVDLSFRAQLAGWKIRYQPSAVAYHHVGKTSSKLGSFARYHSIKNFVLLYTKNMPGWLYWKYLPLFWTQLLRMKLGAIRDKQFGAYVKGVFGSLRLMPRALRCRHSIQHSAKLKSSDIDQMLHHGRPPKVAKL